MALPPELNLEPRSALPPRDAYSVSLLTQVVGYSRSYGGRSRTIGTRLLYSDLNAWGRVGYAAA